MPNIIYALTRCRLKVFILMTSLAIFCVFFIRYSQKSSSQIRRELLLTAKFASSLPVRDNMLNNRGGSDSNATDLDVYNNEKADQINLPNFARHEDVNWGKEQRFCGLKTECPANQVDVYVYSGKNKDDEPKICVNGKFIFEKGLNGAGRGINIVIVNSTSKESIRMAHFDTYAEDSNALEVFLEEMNIDDIIIAVTFDEASTKLTNLAKQMLYEFGSSMIQNIKFRSSWYFVGQKGISGFTPFEELYYPVGDDWAKSIDTKACIPLKLDGLKVRPDPVTFQRNNDRRQFCQGHDGYEDFCEEPQIDNPLKPIPLANSDLANHEIFKIPILIIAGLAHNSLRLCLETVIRQPGINPDRVLVTYDENYPEAASLTKLFKFRTHAIVNSSADYRYQFKMSLKLVWDEYPDAQYFICIEEELMLTIDFLQFMAQSLDLLKADSSILAISSWNDNGFKVTSSSPEVLYRIEDFPGMGFMMSRQIYMDLIKDNFEDCCRNRAFEGWQLKNVKPNIIVPDISRISRRHSDGLGIAERKIEDLFHRERSFATYPVSKLADLDSLKSSHAYDEHLSQLISDSIVWQDAKIRKCVTSSSRIEAIDLISILPETTGDEKNSLKPLRIDFSGKKQLHRLCRCFGLYESPGQPSRGVYRGVLRFSVKQRPVLLVDKKSPLWKFAAQA